MRRRELIGFAGTALFTWPLAARAQSQPKVARLGYLGFGPPAASAPRVSHQFRLSARSRSVPSASFMAEASPP